MEKACKRETRKAGAEYCCRHCIPVERPDLYV
jgi:hypothetical protein